MDAVTEQTRTLLSIQYFRGLAALAVVAMHTGWTRSGMGAAGVDVFFVISGFVMVMVSSREQAPWVFLRARAMRVVPLYWLVTLATVGITGLADMPRIFSSLAFWPHAGYLDGRDFPVVIQGWTLDYEMFFYAAFAASLLLAVQWRLPALTGALLTLVALGRLLPPGGVVATTYTGPLLVEFLAGAWLCRAWQAGRLPSGHGSMALLAAGFLLLGAQFSIGPSGAWRCLTWGIPALMIVAGALGVETAGRLPLVPGLLELGNVSYALYLTHPLVQQALSATLQPLPILVALPAMLVACLGVGLVVHHGIEAPLGTLLRRPRPALPAAMLRPAIMTVAQLRGIPSRAVTMSAPRPRA